MEWVKDVVIPLVSGIGGAVIGAGASYFASSRLAKLASDEVLERDKVARADQDKRAAHQVFVKLHAIANSLGSFQKQTLEMVAKAESDGNSHMPLYQRLSPFGGIERELSIDTGRCFSIVIRTSVILLPSDLQNIYRRLWHRSFEGSRN